MMNQGRARARYSRLLGLALFVALLVLQVSLWLNLFTPRFEMMGVQINLDDDVLFRIEPRSRTDIDADGFRINGNVSRPDARYRMLVLGDSFAFGPNVAPQDSIPAQLEQRLGPEWRTVNLGVMGYGPDQELQQLRKWAWSYRFHPSDIVLVLFPANDFRDVAVNHIFNITKNGKLTLATLLENPVRLPGFRLVCAIDYLVYRATGKTIFFWKLFETYFADKVENPDAVDLGNIQGRDARKLMDLILAEFRESAVQLGARLSVVVLPSFEWATRPSKIPNGHDSAPDKFGEEMLSLCRKNQLSCISLYEVFGAAANPLGYYDPVDRHLSVAGYKKVAESIDKAFRIPRE